MNLETRTMLARLGAGESIESLRQAAGIAPEEFAAWWQREATRRVPPATGTQPARVHASVRIERDRYGIPHVHADNDTDLFFGFGYATAQDRLFQLDYLRRRALGRLSEVLGAEGLEFDLIARTVGLHQIAAAEWLSLPVETQTLLTSYTDGINALIEDSRASLPIEFDLLDYTPEPWSPIDSLAIAAEFRWYLTGRFPVIVIPELARRTLGDGPLYHAFLQGEADEESILPPGSYPARQVGVQSVGATVGDPQESSGSNNWVVSGAHTATGKPLVASDPHIAFAAVSCWHEVHLSGGSFNVTGMTYAGMPAVMFGRNRDVAWGCTNNICSQRDLYQEQEDPAHPGCFLYDGQWEPAQERTEVIQVRNAEPVHKTIRSSRNGPIVDDILPPLARSTGPVALRWLGASPCGWLPALLNMDRARTAAEFREATRPWLVPTFSVVYADRAGSIGYQCVGRIPLRPHWERAYRPGWDPQHQWTGLIPFEGLPHLINPDRGWIVTANNRVAPPDFPYPLSGTWSSGHRSRRVRQMLEAQDQFSVADFGRMQQDSLSLRAEENVPRILKALAASTDKRVQTAATLLQGWDRRMEPDRVGAAIFDVFFAQWSQAVAAQRFDAETAQFIAGAIGGLASNLLAEDSVGWFSSEAGRHEAILTAFNATLDRLTQQFGSDPLNWSWGRIHTIQQKHILSARGDLAKLLDRGNVPVRGNGVTVCNTGTDPNWNALMGAGYRLIADLADDTDGLWAIDAGAESGHPGSPHYDDQLHPWLNGQYHHLPLTQTAQRSSESSTTFTLTPTP